MILYRVSIKKRDNYIYMHDTFQCKQFEVIDTVKCVTTYTENEKVVNSYESIKYRVQNGKNTELIDITNSGEYFKTIDDISKYFKKAYLKVHSDKYQDYYLDIATKNNIICVANLKGLGLANGYVNLKKELDKGTYS